MDKYIKMKFERFLEKEQRESDLEYIARLIIRYCKEHNCVGMSTPTLQGIVKFEFDEFKKRK